MAARFKTLIAAEIQLFSLLCNESLQRSIHNRTEQFRTILRRAISKNKIGPGAARFRKMSHGGLLFKHACIDARVIESSLEAAIHDVRLIFEAAFLSILDFDGTQFIYLLRSHFPAKAATPA